MPKTLRNINTFSPDEIAKAKQIIQLAENNLQQLSLVTNGTGQPATVYLRDGEVVLYKRERSEVWQARFKLYDKRWHCVSTKHYNLQYASRAACEIYDEARFRERVGLSYTRRRFESVEKWLGKTEQAR